MAALRALTAARFLPAARERDGWRLRSTLLTAGWLVVGNMAAGGSAFAVSILRARHLSIEQFGAYALAATLVSFGSILADFGLSVMMVRDLAVRGTDARKYLAFASTLSTGLAGLAAILVITSAGALSRERDVVAVAAVLGLGMVIMGAGMAPAAYLRAVGRAHYEAGGRLLSAAAGILFASLVAAAGGGTVAFAWAAVAPTGVGVAIFWLGVMGPAGVVRPRVDVVGWKRLLRDSVPLGAAMLFTGVYYYADSVMLGAMGQREALARYNAAYVFVMAAAVAVGALRTAFLPAQARGFAGQSGLRAPQRAYLVVSCVLAAGLILGGLAAAKPLLLLVYGEAYAPAAGALRILMLTAGVMCFSSYFGSALLVSGRQHAYLRATAIAAVVNVALNGILIPPYSLNGAATATLFSELAACALVARAGRHTPVAVETTELATPRCGAV